MTYESLPSQMFPMTFEEIRSGTIKGSDRIVTMHSGVYGWPGDRSLHYVYKFDVRGGRASHDFITTIDEHGARTMIELGEHESAVIVKLAVTLPVEKPSNCLVESYDGRSVKVRFISDDSIEVIELLIADEKPSR